MKGNKSGVEQSYAAWISALKRRYRATQIKAAQNGWSRNSLLNWLSTDLVVEVKTGKYEPADLGQLSGYMAMAKHVLNTPGDNQPVGLLICKEHNRVLAKYHLEELGLPMGITDYELKKVLPTKAQLAKCVADAERQVEMTRKGGKG